VLTAGYQAGTFIRALDPFTGKKVWDYQPGGRTGVMTTAGGLVFIGDDGGMGALDAKTGQKLWGVDFGQNGQGTR
jgi:outer membrane protein assembly factor BamB